MIIWLASYPKSGNTFVRSLLSSYFFSQDGIFNFELLKNIKQFPANSLFKQIGVDIENEKEMFKNYINTQKIINKKKDEVHFLKTHGSFVNQENFKFTDGYNTLGVIYIVRDPRNLITSYSHHFQLGIEKSFENLSTNQFLGKNTSEHCTTYLGTWKYHYNSWKIFKKYNRYLLIKYEDLVKDTKKTFIRILEFISFLKREKLVINEKKFQNTLLSTSFKKMQDLENKNDFFEAKENLKTGKKIRFFNMGLRNDWKNLLDINIKDEIEVSFKNEMKDLGYL